MKNEKGFALILTLIITALIATITIGMIHQVYVSVSLSRSFRDAQQASLMAESGAEGAVNLLRDLLADREYTSIISPMKQKDKAGSLEISISEESGKINLNDLVRPDGEINDDFKAMLKRLGESLDIPEEAWEALADWLDADDLARSSGGAETLYYQTQSPLYKAGNTRLTAIAELSLVKGFPPGTVDRLSPFVTVFPKNSGGAISLININTAPKEVLMSMSDKMDDGLADKIMDRRRFQPYKTLGEISTIANDAALSQQLARHATVKGDIFKITVLAKAGDSTRVVETIVRLNGKCLSWREY